MIRNIYLIAIAAFAPVLAWANALTVNITSHNQANQTVTFTLQWQNSWRVTAVPNNWDAAWIFVKFRACGATTEWTHGLLDLAQCVIPTQLEATKADGTPGIDSDNRGLMLRQSTPGIYPTAGPYTVTLKVTNMPTNSVTDPIDIKVFGIEMVFIPSGDFYIGDGNNHTTSQFFPVTLVTSSTNTISQSWPQAFNFDVSSYPKGTSPFYCMKYEISQGQYASFLNTLSSAAQVNRYPGNFGSYRNRLTNTGTPPNMYTSDAPDRAQNYLGYGDVSAYLDWACLRPMSELEYEKVCRGPMAPVANEYAWGNTTLNEGTTISSTMPLENGTEIFIDTPTPNCNLFNNNFLGSPASGGPTWPWRGPVRVGIFALPTSTRQTSGGTYYGVMEMSGNVSEYVVALSQLTTTIGFSSLPPVNNNARVFTGSNGDGTLSADGFHNQNDWPIINSTTWPPYSTTNAGQPTPLAIRQSVGLCGGGWSSDGWECRVSDRYYTVRNSHWDLTNNNGFALRYETSGGRGVRGSN
jgi:formylglycine-generating enzyme required for sulfatase activity